MIWIVPESVTTRYQLGQFGEDVVRSTLCSLGYDVQSARKGEGGDLIAGGLRIEVKTAAQNRDGGYRFCLWKEGCTDHRKSDVVILLCCSSGGLITTFVLPSDALTNKEHLHIPRIRSYRGKYREYRKSIKDGLRRFVSLHS
jgi:hypothetical protein